MSDQNAEQTSRELTESAIIPAVNKGFIKEAKEIEAAKYVLNEELIYGFENHDTTFVLEREPQKIFNKGLLNKVSIVETKETLLLYATDNQEFNVARR